MSVRNHTRFDREFDRRYAYEGCDLGAVCTPDRTVFKLWSPEASGVELFLYHQDDTGPWFGHWRLEPEDREEIVELAQEFQKKFLNDGKQGG